MGGLFSPKVKSFDPTSPVAKQTQQQLQPFIQAFLRNPQGFGQVMSPQNPLTMFANQQLMNALGGPQSPLGLAGQTVESMRPVFQRNLQESLGQLQSAAPGRFSSAFMGQGADLASRANQDFNVFMNQALQQGLSQHQNLLGMAAQSGLQQQQVAQNPVLQMLNNVFGFAQPQNKQAIVGQSPLGQLTNLATLGIMGAGMFGKRSDQS